MDRSHTFYLNNLNELLNYDDIVGIKTGFTNEAGGVLLTAIRKNKRLLIVSVLKSQDRFADTKDLVEFIHEKVNYSLPAEDWSWIEVLGNASTKPVKFIPVNTKTGRRYPLLSRGR